MLDQQFPGFLSFELRYHLRRPTTAIAVVIFGFLAFALTAFGRLPGESLLNSPYQIAHGMALLTIASVFPLTVLCAQSVLRNSTHRMTEVIYSTALTRGTYLLGSFAAVWLVAVAIFAWVPLGQWLGHNLGLLLGRHDPSQLGPIHAFDYLWSFVVLVVPNLLIVGSLLFALAVLSRSTLATYVGGVVVYMLYFAVSMLGNSPLIATSTPATPEGLAWAALLDPFGLAAVIEQTHTWSLDELNRQRLALSGHLLSNRLLWMALAGCVLAVVYRVFHFRITGTAKRARRRATLDTAPSIPHRTSSLTPTLPPPAPEQARAWLPSSLAAWLSTVRLDLQQTLRSWPLLALLVLWAGLSLLEIQQYVQHAEYGSTLLPSTALLVARLQEASTLIGLVLLVFFSAELVWRERSVGMAPIVDATPASNALFLTSKLTVLSCLLLLLTAVSTTVAVTFQLSAGYFDLDLGVYASQLYFSVLPLAIVGVVAVALQTLSANRYLGLLLTAAAVVVWYGGALGHLNHPLLQLASMPEVPYSAMAGFGPETESFHWLTAYWSLFAILLGIVTTGLWRRGTDARLRFRLTALPALWRGPAGRPVRYWSLALTAAWLLIGGAIWHQVHAVHGYETADDVHTWRADYERRYQHLEALPQPSLVHLSATIDLYPRQRRFSTASQYQLRNDTDLPIDTVWVTVPRDARIERLVLAGPSLNEQPDGGPLDGEQLASTSDARFGVHRFDLAQPLPPGEEAELRVDLEIRRGGVQAGGVDRDILANGSFLFQNAHGVSLGYQAGRELRDPVQRRRQGLPPSQRALTLEGAMVSGQLGDSTQTLTLDVTLSTDGDQIPLGPGRRVATGEHAEGGAVRRWARFVLERPVVPFLAYASGRYAVERRTAQPDGSESDIEVEVYYHPPHARNARYMLDAATDALEDLSRRFGPYPLDHLRLIETPSLLKRGAGLATPGTIFMVEDRGFLTDLDADAPLDLLTKRISHEVAHQWWGHQVTPAEAPGASVLVESTARYSELITLDKRQGIDAVTAALRNERNFYLGSRSRGDVPLFEVLNQPYLYYSKGALVMMAADDLLGRPAVEAALRRLVARARAGDRRLTSRHLIDELQRDASARQRALLEDWFTRIVFYDLRLGEARAEALPDGSYRLTLDVHAARHALDDGSSVPLDFDEDIQLALYRHHPAAHGRGEARILVEHHRLRGDDQLVLEVAELPRYVEIDPFLRRIDRNLADNLIGVKEEGNVDITVDSTGRAGP